MELAVNYSNPLVELVSQQLVEIDLIKCPDWEGMIEEAQSHGKVIIHYNLFIGLGNIFPQDLSRIQRLKEQTNTPHINAHLTTPKYFNSQDERELQKINDLWREELGLLVNRFGEDFVALEHYPYTTANSHLKAAADCDTFSQVIKDTGCRFLLDLAHARITADTLGIDVREYIQGMPLDRLVEIHTTGIKRHAGILTDHFELLQEDWELLEWALAEIRAGCWREPRLVAFEYGGIGDVFFWRTDINILRTQIPRLFEMLHHND